MDTFLKNHLDVWLRNHSGIDYLELEKYRTLITDYVNSFPQVIDKGYGWPEILKRAERKLKTTERKTE